MIVRAMKSLRLSGDHPLIVLLTAVLLSVGPALAQKAPDLSRDTLARIGPGGITTLDLLQRLELMPFPDRTKNVNSDSIKAMGLHALIAEKVLANEQRRLGIPEDQNNGVMQRELENALIRDELYRQHIVDNVEVSPAEITQGLNRITKVNKVLAFLVQGEEDARSIAAFLRTAKPDSVLGTVPASLYTECDTLTIKFGAPDTSFERAAFAIGKSRVSAPFSSARFGWAVLYLLDRTTDREAVGMSLQDRSRRVEKILRARHETALYEEYYARILKSKHASGDSTTFNILADTIVALWREDTAHFQSRGYYILTGDLVDLLTERLRPVLERTCVTLEDGALTLGEILEMFRYADFQSKYPGGISFKADLNEAIRNLVGNELLAREGKKEGLEHSPAVQHDLQLWTDYWAARAVYYRVRDSVMVTDDEILAHLVKNAAIFGRYFEVNIREVLCDSLREMDSALRELDRGKSLAEVAREYSKRRAWAARGGESGFFDVSLHPEIGFLALNTDSGKLAGPVKVPEGVSLFQVLGKRLTPKAVTNFDILRKNVRARLLVEKRKRAIDRFIAEAARDQHVTIDYEKLKRVAYNRVPMFTRRLIGFGGRMSAAPMLMKLWDWTRQYRPPEEVIP